MILIDINDMGERLAECHQDIQAEMKLVRAPMRRR